MHIADADLAKDSADDYRSILDEIVLAVDQLRQEIAELESPQAEPPAPPAAADLAAADIQPASGRGGRRAEGEDLTSYILKVLAQWPTGLKAADTAEKVVEIGYQTASKHLTQAVSNALTKLVSDGRVAKNEETKTYRLPAINIDTDNDEYQEDK